MKSLALFSHEGGVGKTTLTFNLAHMMAREGWRVAVLDYDPQCNISQIFLEEERLVECWQADGSEGATVAACVEPVRQGTGDVVSPTMIDVAPGLWLLPGQLSLSRFEHALADRWARTMNALGVLSNLAAERVDADVIFIDVGSSLGLLSRAAVRACDHMVVPLAPDPFSLQALADMGPMLRQWRSEGAPHDFTPLGYILQQPLARVDRPLTTYARWAELIPGTFWEQVLGEVPPPRPVAIDHDPYCVACLKPFASLAPHARQARKPMFDLRQADGVSGGQIQAVKRCGEELLHLVHEIAKRAGIPNP